MYYLCLTLNPLSPLPTSHYIDTCYDRLEKYIAEALEPIIKFRRYRAFKNGTIREFYFLLRSTMVGARRAGLLHRPINDQTLPSMSIMAQLPLNDWKQWAREGPSWVGGIVEDA
jgi:hypothetical protein